MGLHVVHLGRFKIIIRTFFSSTISSPTSYFFIATIIKYKTVHERTLVNCQSSVNSIFLFFSCETSQIVEMKASALTGKVQTYLWSS
jgi:hypothetical protein